jgi:hypothetical protein
MSVVAVQKFFDVSSVQYKNFSIRVASKKNFLFREWKKSTRVSFGTKIFRSGKSWHAKFFVRSGGWPRKRSRDTRKTPRIWECYAKIAYFAICHSARKLFLPGSAPKTEWLIKLKFLFGRNITYPFQGYRLCATMVGTVRDLGGIQTRVVLSQGVRNGNSLVLVWNPVKDKRRRSRHGYLAGYTVKLSTKQWYRLEGVIEPRIIRLGARGRTSC